MSERQRHLDRVKEEQRQRRIDQIKYVQSNPSANPTAWVLMSNDIRWYDRYIRHLEYECSCEYD